MQRDERVLVMGEDVGRKGGVFGATDGLYAKFGEARVLDTPLAESGIVGVAIRSEEHTSELQSLAYLVCRLLLEKKKKTPVSPPRRGPTRGACAGLVVPASPLVVIATSARHLRVSEVQHTPNHVNNQQVATTSSD